MINSARQPKTDYVYAACEITKKVAKTILSIPIMPYQWGYNAISRAHDEYRALMFYKNNSLMLLSNVSIITAASGFAFGELHLQSNPSLCSSIPQIATVLLGAAYLGSIAPSIVHGVIYDFPIAPRLMRRHMEKSREFFSDVLAPRI